MEEYVREITVETDPSELPPALVDDLAEEERNELTFGEYLRRERVLRGISREEILSVTKVTPEYYDHLEANRFESLPQKAFVVGFLKVLSDFAGLDSVELVNRYIGESGAKDPDLPKAPSRGFMARYRRKILFGLGAFTVLVLMVVPLFKN